jgi:hypothetical protein
MIDQPQILSILETRLQSTVEIVPKRALLIFQKIYSSLHILEIVNVLVLNTGIGAPMDHKQINTRNIFLERRWWVVEGLARPGKKKKEVTSLQLNLSSERGGITR